MAVEVGHLITVAGLAMLVSACGGGSPTASRPGPMSSPATTAISATRFTAKVTDGWRDLTADPAAVDRMQPPGAVLLLLESAPPSPVVHGVDDVVADIIVMQLPLLMQREQFAGYLRSVTTHGASNVSAVTNVDVGGANGSMITYTYVAQGTPLQSEDVLVDDNGITYEIELNTSRYAFASQRATLSTMLSSWRWSTAV